jgi:hypothetical protein
MVPLVQASRGMPRHQLQPSVWTKDSSMMNHSIDTRDAACAAVPAHASGIVAPKFGLDMENADEEDTSGWDNEEDINNHAEAAEEAVDRAIGDDDWQQ